jgi:hypothetical protein
VLDIPDWFVVPKSKELLFGFTPLGVTLLSRMIEPWEPAPSTEGTLFRGAATAVEGASQLGAFQLGAFQLGAFQLTLLLDFELLEM